MPGLVDSDIESRGMGQSGTDVVFSNAAIQHFPFDIECKNCEVLNVFKIFWGHDQTHSKSKNTKLLVHSRNHSEPLVTMKFSDFGAIIKEALSRPSDNNFGAKEAAQIVPTAEQAIAPQDRTA